MNKPMDLAIHELKLKLIESLNTSGVPISVMEYVVKDVLEAVTKQKVDTLNELMKQQEEPIKVEQIEEV